MTDEYLTIEEAAKMLKSREADVMETIIQGGVNWTRIPPNSKRKDKVRINAKSLERYLDRATGDVATRPVIAKYPEH